MSAIKNAMPESRLQGIRDASTRAEVVEPLSVPQHCPLFYIQAERGPLTAQAIGQGLAQTYGVKSFDERSKYYSHATMGLTAAIGAGNMCFVKRLVPADSSAGSLVFTLEVVKDDILDYVRNTDGSVTLDASGLKTFATTSTTGYRLKWATKPLSDLANLRGEAALAGTMTGTVGGVAQASTVYPIFAFKGGVGDYINNVGIKLSFPGPNTATPADMDIMDDQMAALYRASWMERNDALSTPRTLAAIDASTSIDFCLKAGAVNTKTGEDLSIDRVLSSYANTPADGTPPTFGPVDEMYVYDNNVQTIVDLIQAEEVLQNTAVTGSDFINLFNTLDSLGNDLFTARIDGGLSLNAATTHYLKGGSDGTVSEAELNTLVFDACSYGWEDVADPLVDRAKYPFSVVYDTGFAIDTKKAILGLMAFRADISVAVTPQDVLQAVNTISAETSIATSLRATGRLVPESVIHGTPTCRAVIVGGAGRKLYNKYGKAIPVVVDLIVKRARYMGAGNGKFKNAFAYDVAPANQLKDIVDVANAWKPRAVRSADWDIGLNAVQYMDMNTLFFPAMQTIYDNDTSVLNSDIVMLIAVDVVKKSDQVWRMVTGNGTMSDSQFLTTCDNLMLELTDGIYDDRVVVRPNASFTKADEARGYSWVMNTEVYANSMRTVGTMNVSVHRKSDL